MVWHEYPLVACASDDYYDGCRVCALYNVTICDTGQAYSYKKHDMFLPMSLDYRSGKCKWAGIWLVPATVKHGDMACPSNCQTRGYGLSQQLSNTGIWLVPATVKHHSIQATLFFIIPAIDCQCHAAPQLPRTPSMGHL